MAAPWHYSTIKGMSSAYAQYAKCPVLPKMTNNRTALSIAIMLFICAVPSRAADFSRSEEILAHHLDAIATGRTRTGFKARVVEGTAIYKILAGGTGSIEGKGVVASETNRTRFLFKVVGTLVMGNSLFVTEAALTWPQFIPIRVV